MESRLISDDAKQILNAFNNVDTIIEAEDAEHIITEIEQDQGLSGMKLKKKSRTNMPSDITLWRKQRTRDTILSSLTQIVGR